MKINLLLLFTLVFSCSLSAQVLFQDHNISNTVDGAFFTHSVDLDGDGDMDVLSASISDDLIGWFENLDGQGTFGTFQLVSELVDDPNAIYPADLDGDGDYDVISASGRDDKIAWYENLDGQGTFGGQQIVTSVLNNPKTVFAKDLDGDGDIDIISASFLDHEVVWYENLNGLGDFGGQQIISSTETYPHAVFAVDIDDDGDMDVISALLLDGVVWYKNTDGQGNFITEQVLDTDGSQTVFSEDLDNDGDMDILSGSSEHLFWFENVNGSGNFNNYQTISMDPYGLTSVNVSDIDGDGDMDALYASRSSNTIAWYENLDGQGTFGSQLIISDTAAGAIWVHTVDIDGDGDNDVISASISDDSITWYENLGNNDYCVDAITLTIGETLEANNEWATTSPEIPECFDEDRADVWFTFNTGSLNSIDVMVNTGYNLQLWSGNCGSLTHVSEACGSGMLEDIAVTEETDYFLQVWSCAGCRLVLGMFDVLVQDSSLSIEEVGSNGLSMYPNPVKNILNIEANDKISCVRVYNLLGQQVLINNPYALKEKVDLAQIKSGMYLVEVYIGKQITTFKIIKE